MHSCVALATISILVQHLLRFLCKVSAVSASNFKKAIVKLRVAHLDNAINDMIDESDQLRQQVAKAKLEADGAGAEMKRKALTLAICCVVQVVLIVIDAALLVWGFNL